MYFTSQVRREAICIETTWLCYSPVLTPQFSGAMVTEASGLIVEKRLKCFLGKIRNRVEKFPSFCQFTFRREHKISKTTPIVVAG